MKSLLFVFLCLVVANDLIAQKPEKTKSPSKLAKEAADFEKSGDLLKAAVYYESAFAQKEDNLEWMYQAGRCYLFVRDYANAAKCLERVKDQEANPKFDKPGYKYALALKQAGQYGKAREAFEAFVGRYNGADAENMRKIVDTEIKGCNYAIKALEAVDNSIALQHLPSSINTEKVEFAPIAFDGNVLYFSSTQSGVAAIYRTQKNGTNWTRPVSPDLFAGKMEKPNFGNGSFTPDGKRFYFTQCGVGANNEPSCAIYAMVDESGNGEWERPVKLPDYINMEGATTTHPNVVVEGDKEILYFSSNREGGKGGLDIWYCTRTVGSKGFNFTLPKNLGNNLNTSGDEITPFYHTPTQTLYFSSNGWVSIGGLDIFKSQGSQLKWEVPQNLGFPFCSAADDLYYILSESHGGGYLVSNRTFDPSKVATTNDDIFYYGQNKVEVTIRGKIFDCKSKATGDAQTLTDVNVKLFEMVEAGEELLENRMLAVGEYKFVLQPKKKYLVEMSREDYATSSFEINTFEFNRTETHSRDVCLEVPSVNIADVRAMIVPLEHNAAYIAYTLPQTPPTDPKTKKPYAEGTDVYKEFKRIEAIANQSEEHKVYYDGDGGEIVAYIADKVAEPTTDPVKTAKVDKRDGPRRNFQDDQYKSEGENITFRVQVAAVRKLREKAYTELKKISGLKMDFEAIDGGLTRVVLVPDTDNKFFATKADALDALMYVLDNTRFKSAFVARYENGERKGDGFRGWDEEETNTTNKTESGNE